jgi:hypothetical protein
MAGPTNLRLLTDFFNKIGQWRPVRASSGSVHVWYALKADVEIGILALARCTFAEYGPALHTIQVDKMEPRKSSIFPEKF